MAWSISQLPSWVNLHGLEMLPPSRKGHNGQKLQPEPNSEPLPDFRCTKSRFRSAEGACRALVTKPTPNLCSYSSVLTLLAQRASSLGIPEPQSSSLACPPEERRCPWGNPETLNEDQAARHSTLPQLYNIPCKLMPGLTQPRPEPPDQHSASWLHTEHVGPDMDLSRHLFPSSVFRLHNLDLNSNHGPAVKEMKKSDILLPHCKNTWDWHGPNVQCRINSADHDSRPCLST